MLALPALPVDDAAMVFGDDEDPHTFYAVPAVPRLRTFADGSAALSLLTYRTSGDGSGDGGLLEFQTRLTFSEEERARITAAVAQRTGGPISLREPDYIDGAVELHTFRPEAGGLVEAIETSAHPTLTDDHAAAFSVTLSRSGAVFFDTALRSDPAPVVVRYTLSFLARLPQGRVHVWLRSGPLRAGWDGVAHLDPLARRTAIADVAGVEVLDWPPAGDPTTDELRRQLVDWGWATLDQAGAGALTRPAGAPPDWTGITDVDVVLTGDSTIAWPVHPQATLSGFDPSTFRKLDLSDAIFDRIEVQARCNADFARDRIHSVLLRLRYGDRHQETLLTDTETAATFVGIVDPALGFSYAWSAVVQFAFTDRRIELPETTTDAPLLVVDVGDVGWLRVDVSGAAIDWDQVALVEVGISYADPDHGVEDRVEAAVLRPDAPQVAIERPIWAPLARPWRHRETYVLTDGTRVERPWQERTGRTLVVPALHDRVLSVRLVAPAGDDTVAGVVVECCHDAADGHATSDTVTLDAATGIAIFRVPLMPADPEEFRYRVTTTYTDGHSEQTGWTTATGSQTVVVGDPPESLTTVDVVADLVDFTQVKLVRVALRHTPKGRAERTENLVFSAGHTAQQTWKVPIWPGDARGYSWSAEFYLTDATRRSIPPTDADDPVLVLQLPAA